MGGTPGGKFSRGWVRLTLSFTVGLRQRNFFLDGGPNTEHFSFDLSNAGIYFGIPGIPALAQFKLFVCEGFNAFNDGCRCVVYQSGPIAKKLLAKGRAGCDQGCVGGQRFASS